jgi:hypothetical protein
MAALEVAILGCGLITKVELSDILSRRDDTGWITGRILDRLGLHYANVFADIDAVT